ncbi:MAG: SAF domain-containing protein, partial [Oribacterium sp.]|nr:SAF domain-containing protein [Oribacterium sp.]
MANKLCIRITDKDNVAIAIHDLQKGTEVMPGVVTATDIPQAHKIALMDLPKGSEV